MSGTGKDDHGFKHGLLRKYIYLIVAGVLLATGVTMSLVGANIPANICFINGGAHNLDLFESSRTLTCTFTNQSLESDLSLYASFVDINRTAVEFYPLTNAQIIDPSGTVLQNVNFTDQVSISVKPQTIGDYKAIITFLDKHNQKYNAHTQLVIQYGFVKGYVLLTNFETSIMEIGGILNLAGFIFLVYGGIKAIRKIRKSHLLHMTIRQISIIAIVCIVVAFTIWYFTSYDPAPVTKQNTFGISARVIRDSTSVPSTIFGGTSHYFLKIKSDVNTCGLLGYNICYENSCVKKDEMRNSLLSLGVSHPDYQELPLPDNLPWKDGYYVNVQVKIESPANTTDPSSHPQNIWVDLGKSTIGSGS